MHPNAVFRWDDRLAMLAFVRVRSFATLVGVIDGAARVAQVPLLVDGTDRVLLHLSRTNALAKVMPLPVVAIVHGPDAYVSPDWYASADQVPTWNYTSVELEGTLAPTDEAMLRDIVERLSTEHERRLTDKPPWSADQLTPAVFAAMLGALVGATLSLDLVRGTRKLSQNRAVVDRERVFAALSASERPQDREIAAAMRRAQSQVASI